MQTAWRVVYVLSTLYSWSWDVLMDWSLVEWAAGGGLRQRRMLPGRAVYLAAAAFDLVLRFGWAATLIPATSLKRSHPPHFLFFVVKMCKPSARTCGFLIILTSTGFPLKQKLHPLQF